MNFLLEINEYEDDNKKTTFDWIRLDNQKDLEYFIKWMNDEYTYKCGESCNYTKEFSRLKNFIDSGSIKFKYKHHLELIGDKLNNIKTFNYKLIKISEYIEINNITTNENIDLVKNSKIDVYKVYIDVGDKIYVESKKNNFYVITKDNIESIQDGANFRDKGMLFEDWVSLNEFAHNDKIHLFMGAKYRLNSDYTMKKGNNKYALVSKSNLKSFYDEDLYILINVETDEKYAITYNEMIQHSEML